MAVGGGELRWVRATLSTGRQAPQGKTLPEEQGLPDLTARGKAYQVSSCSAPVCKGVMPLHTRGSGITSHTGLTLAAAAHPALGSRTSPGELSV